MPPRLRILAVNDVYSLEHLPRLRSMVQHYAEQDPADVMLVTMAGDFLAPSILSSLDFGAGMVDCLNRIPITHAILGNHEDDLEVPVLRRRLGELKATLLLTNVRGLGESFPEQQVVTVGDVKVGVVGVVDGDVTLYRRAPFGGAEIEKPNDAARRHTDALVAGGCAFVIAITHQRISDDRALAQPTIPLILGGHEHDGHLETVGTTTLIKAPSDAARVGVVDVVCTTPPTIRAKLEDVTTYPEDADLKARVDAHLAPVRELQTATLLILKPGEVVSSIGTRARQTSMGTLICSRLRDAFAAEACIFNGGGIRGSREYRDRLTYGDIEGEVPFDNEIVLARLPGSVLAEAIAFSRAQAPRESGGFLQVDDRLELDERHRVVSVFGAPFDPARDYRVALVRDLFEGMDQIEPLIRFARAHPDRVPMVTSGREVKVVLLGALCSLLLAQLGGFDALDRNHDGVVTAEELLAAITHATHQPTSEMSARVLIDALDTNDDHALSREEVPSGPGSNQ